MKKLIIGAIIALCLTACSQNEYKKFTGEFDDVFDTVTIVSGYEKNSQDFDKRLLEIHDEMARLHKLYDAYNDYDGVNNIKTINDNAGVKPIKADEDLLGLIEFGIEAYKYTEGAVNIALGPVLKIWHEYREIANTPELADIPPIGELEEAAAYTGIDNIVIDKEAGTVFLKDPKASLDVGAIAKGYAVGIAGKKAALNGFDSGVISSGGNIYSLGSPKDGREYWNIGIQNPFAAIDGNQIYDTVAIDSKAVVSSGDYQRFYIANGQKLHHIIDPKSFMPADNYSGVTVIHQDSGIADMLSTAAFIMPYNEGKALVEGFKGEALWIFKDKTWKATNGYKEVSGL